MSFVCDGERDCGANDRTDENNCNTSKSDVFYRFTIFEEFHAMGRTSPGVDGYQIINICNLKILALLSGLEFAGLALHRLICMQTFSRWSTNVCSHVYYYYNFHYLTDCLS